MADADPRTALSLSAGHLLDQVRTGRMLLDLVDALIVVTITQANIEPVLRDPALQAAYATYDTPPPDDIRRPISINAVALSLKLPFETVRRRVVRLARFGLCRQGPDGLVAPTARVNGPDHRRALVAAYDRLGRLHAALSDLGLLDAASPPAGGRPPLRAAARLSGAYLLRVADGAAQALGDVIDAAVWLEVFRSNTEGRLAAASPGGEALRRPVAAATAACRLGLAQETVRRRLAGLIAGGACARVAGSYIVPDAVLLSPAIERLAERNLADLRRMYAALAALGSDAASGAVRAA